MWFGTKDGLNRFDGYHFKNFNLNNGNERSLTRDVINSLAAGKDGRLWVGSQKGVYLFAAEKERLIPFIDTLPDANDLFIDKSGQLWFLSVYTVCRYNFEKKQLSIFPADKYFNATSICQLNDGSMWFSTDDGYLQQFDNKTQTFKAYNVFAHSPSPASRLIKKIVPGKKGSIYIGTSSQGIKQFDEATLEYKDLLTYNTDKTTVFVRDILQAEDHQYWFATESGIFILNTETGEFTNLRKKNLDPYSLSDNAIYTLHKDKEGGIWAGTFFGGINYFPKQYSPFQKYFPDYTTNSISGSAVREICEDSFGNIWIGTEDAGLNKLNAKTGKFTRFEAFGSSTDIAYSNIHGLLVVKDDLWIGTFEHGLDIMDIRTGKVKKHYAAGPANNLKSNFIVTMLQTRNGDIYIGSANSLLKYLPATDKFIPVEEVPGNIFVSSLIEDHEGNIWVGTGGNGIYYFNPVTKEKRHFVNEPNNNNSLTTNWVNALYEDSFRNFWFATEGGGLCRLSKDKKQVTRYTTNTGLPSNSVFKVLEDNKKNIWTTTSKGLVKLDILHNATTVYTKANGLLNDQFNYNSGYKDSEGKLYFGSVRGMITFKPDEFLQNKFIPPVYITGFQLHNKELEINKDTSVLKKSIVYTKKIVLSHNQSSFSIDFAALSFTTPAVTEYNYIMEGLDKDRTHIKPNRKVYFTNLKPGTYQFKVKAASNGVWSKEETQLTIEILPPFWGTRAAYLLYIVLSASLLYYLIRTYHNKVMNKKEKEIYEAKIEFFTNIAHEIRTPLTLIKGPVENLSEMMNDVPEIKADVAMMERNTNRLVNLINQILDFRKIETTGFSLDFTNVNISEVLKEAYLTFEHIAKKRKLHYSIDLPSTDVYIMADGEALNKIFSNLFSNALKYADKEVHIKLIPLNKDERYLVIELRNDGFIIPDDMKEKIFEPFYRLKETVKQKGTGIGLALARSLAELHKGNLFVGASEESMNVFVLRLPYQSFISKKMDITQSTKPVVRTN